MGLGRWVPEPRARLAILVQQKHWEGRFAPFSLVVHTPSFRRWEVRWAVLDDAANERLRDNRELLSFQLAVAEQWRGLGTRYESDPHLAFVCRFAAVNALYWVWGRIFDWQAFEEEERAEITNALDDSGLHASLARRVKDRLRGLRNEYRLLRDMVREMPPEYREELLANESVQTCVEFLLEREPVERMERRQRDVRKGDPEAGASYKRKLAEPAKRLDGLVGILYIVRCNLVHGNKEALRDEETELLRKCSPAVNAFGEQLAKFVDNALATV